MALSCLFPTQLSRANQVFYAWTSRSYQTGSSGSVQMNTDRQHDFTVIYLTKHAEAPLVQSDKFNMKKLDSPKGFFSALLSTCLVLCLYLCLISFLIDWTHLCPSTHLAVCLPSTESAVQDIMHLTDITVISWKSTWSCTLQCSWYFVYLISKSSDWLKQHTGNSFLKQCVTWWQLKNRRNDGIH